jgi:hypothetical protein
MPPLTRMVWRDPAGLPSAQKGDQRGNVVDLGEPAADGAGFGAGELRLGMVQLRRELEPRRAGFALAGRRWERLGR